MDFYDIVVHEKESKDPTKSSTFEVYPDFKVGRSKDLMIRGRSFYAIWDEKVGLWSTDEYDVQRLVDESLRERSREVVGTTSVKYMSSFSNNVWTKFQNFLKNLSDNAHQLDESLTFANQEVKRSDFVSRKLPYALEDGDHSAWDELMGVLYSDEERAKIEWAIGAIVSGDSKKIQKFLVLYGPAGTGKSTVLNIVQNMFEGYTTSFEAKALGSNNGSFATEAFRHNPLVAIQHDGDLSRIEDNTRLNSIISHEDMTMNEKYKPSYTARVNAFLLMGTNQPVKISDAKSGIIRRLIDVHPTGTKLAPNHYHALMARIDFELGAIAHHCLQVYRSMGKNAYNNYRPTEMMFQTDIFFNFIEWHYDIFKAQGGVSLKQAYALYKEFCSETGLDKPMPQYKFREELRNYFDEFKDRVMIDGETVRSYYSGFNAEKYKAPVDDSKTFSLVLEETSSLFDHEYPDQPAQYGTALETPKKSWSKVTTTLAEIDTTQLHFVKIPEQHIVIDFDLRDENGDKSLERNLKEASAWPATYAEISKSGSGVHLHYNYDGDVTKLRNEFAEGIEVKVFTGNSSLRRRLLKCNNVPVATMRNTLPLKEEKKMLNSDTIQNEKGLRNLIIRNLNKDIHPGTKPSIDFIRTILDQAYEDGLVYDVTDMQPKIIAFANESTNHAMHCLKQVQKMKFKGLDPVGPDVVQDKDLAVADDRLVFYDVEVYPNLLVVCWKFERATEVQRMINPSPQEIENLLKLKLVGFNVRRYDNHILYARMMGYDNEAIYNLSQKIVNNITSALFGEAYGLSYADIYDFSSKKQTLKRFQIELGLTHMEMGLPWDEPVPEEKWPEVVEYCVNDVITTEVVFEDREQDFVARQILAELSGLRVNDPTNKHTAKIIFGGDRDAQKTFEYTDLSEMFPGYEFDMGKSKYKSRFAPKDSEPEDPGEGGYVYAERGMYENVALLDVASMHPTSIIELNMFGPYTGAFKDLLDARLAIKRGQFDLARQMLGGRLALYLKSEQQAKDLAYALKIVINIVYGMTSAKFDNPFRDVRNKDNIVAKRGALFMIDLKHAVQKKGYTVVHIKTDSIKIANADQKIIDFVFDFGAKYGYDFEHEATYDMMCLVNDAVYVTRTGSGETAKFSATGAQFQHPYVYKTLFSEEPIVFDDLCETRQVQKGAMYLDFPGLTGEQLHFVGKSGRFVPVTEESGVGGHLFRINDGKRFAVTGTKDHLWIEADTARALGNDLQVDMNYFEALVNAARDEIDKWGPYEVFANG